MREHTCFTEEEEEDGPMYSMLGGEDRMQV